MKIGFDVSQTAEKKAGCGYYAEQIIEHLLKIDQDNEYLLYPVFYNYRHPNFKKAYQNKAQNVKSMFMDYSWQRVNEIWKQNNNLEYYLGFPDIVHANNFSCPKYIKTKKVFTLYDVGFLDCFEYTTEENRLVCFEGVFEASIYADHIIAISDFSKKAFLKYFPHYPEERISVIYLGSRPSLHPVSDERKIKDILDKHSIKDQFWLGVGTIEPRKNYRLLLEAYARLVDERNEERLLVIAGGSGWLEEDIQDEVTKLGIRDKTKFLGYVSDEELSVLYSTCHGFVFPSNYEGFGLPVLEAMSCGAPVITSKVTSLPEVAGDAALYIDPKSADSLVMAMNKMDDLNLRRQLKQESIRQAAKFSWTKAAEEILQIYEKVLECEPWLATS